VKTFHLQTQRLVQNNYHICNMVPLKIKKKKKKPLIASKTSANES